MERAQALFEELSARAGAEILVILLHSRFLKAHRRDKEDKVRYLFGKDRNKAGSVILIATQVIEVGLDITCEVMHTEVAPASAILQRAGRCARFEGEKSDVYIYQVPLNQKGQPNYAPYLGEQATLCEKTWEALASKEFDGVNMDFMAEQSLVNQVHTEADSRMLSDLEQTRYSHRKDMEKAISQQEMGSARELIRHDDSATVIVHPNPSDIENPYDLEGFSLFFGSLHGQFEKWREAGLPNGDISWLLKCPQEKESGEGEERPTRYEWVTVGDRQELKRSFIHVVNPLLVKYNPDIGFCFARGESFQSPPQGIKPTELDRQRRYSQEFYQEHIQRMLDFYQSRLSRGITYSDARLGKRMGLAKGTLERAIRLAIALHDVGKMDRRWQGWAHEWQKRIGVPVAEDDMLAHTYYDSKDPNHQAEMDKMPVSRPPHAAEGAVAVLKLLHQILGGPRQNDPQLMLVKALFTAITRHHSPGADSYSSFALLPAAQGMVAQVLAMVGEDSQVSTFLETNKKAQPITGVLVEPGAWYELLAYFIIVRALRLADQGATARKE